MARCRLPAPLVYPYSHACPFAKQLPHSIPATSCCASNVIGSGIPIADPPTCYIRCGMVWQFYPSKQATRLESKQATRLEFASFAEAWTSVTRLSSRESGCVIMRHQSCLFVRCLSYASLVDVWICMLSPPLATGTEGAGYFWLMSVSLKLQN